MSAISLKSITGITSITTPAGVDNQLTLHNNNTTEAVKLDIAGNLHINNHLAVAGLSTFTGAVTAHDYRSGGGVGNTLYLTSADDWRFRTTGGSERLKITSAGQVQINTDGGSGALTLGASQDFKLYHDAGGPTIFSDTGNQGFKLQIKELNLTEYSGTTTRLKIDTNGNVGVGNFTSTSISQLLHVRGSQPSIYLEHTGGYDMTLTTNDGMGQNGITVNGGFLSLAYNNKNIVMCRTGGSVGINSTSPQAKLEVDGRFRILDNSDGTPSTGKGLEISYYTSDDLADILSYDRGAGAYKKLQLRGSSIELKKNNSVLCNIGTGGNGVSVGFSTTVNLVTNGEKIAVRGYSSFKSTNPAYAAIYVGSEGNTNDTANQLVMFNNNGANRGGIGYVPNTGELRFNNQYFMTFCTGSTLLNGTERLRITATGKIEVQGTRAGSLQADDDDTLKLYTKSTSADINRGTGITFYTHDGSGYEMGGTIQVAKETAGADNPASYMRFSTQSGSTTTERLRIDSSGRLIVGDTANRLVWGINPHLQVNGTDWDDTCIAIQNFGNNTRRPTLLFTKGKSGTLGNYGTSPAAGDGLGIIGWSAHDTTDAENLACYIQGITTQVATANNQYGAIIFSTVNGGTTAYERLRISSHGGTVVSKGGSPNAASGWAGLEVKASSSEHQLVLSSTSTASNSNYSRLGFKLHPSNDNERVKAAIVCQGSGGGYGEVSRMMFCLDNTADNGNADGNGSDERLRIQSDGKVKIGGGTASLALLHIAPADYSLNLQNNSNNKSMILFGKNGTPNDSRSWIEGNGELNGYVAIGAGDDERFKIDSNGWTYHNTTSNGTTNGSVGKRYNWGSDNNLNFGMHCTTRQRYSIWEHRQIGRTNERASQMSCGENTSNQGIVYIYSSTANADVTGGVVLTNGATSWSGVSDMRLKNKTGDILNALEDINKIEPIKFTWKYGPDNNPHVGVSAQSVENVVPEAIERGVDVERQREGDETEYMRVRYTELIPLSIAAIKELKAEVESLKAEIASLKSS